MMNHKEHFTFLKNCGISLSEERVITRLVDNLIFGVLKPDEELMYTVDRERLKKFEIKDEPVNWGSLRVVEVRKFDAVWEVFIEEASPNDCPTFCAYIERFMRAWGWKVEVITEW